MAQQRPHKEGPDAHMLGAPECRRSDAGQRRARRRGERPRGRAKAPDFALNGVDGKPVKLSDLTAKGPVVIYTFIAAFTPT